MPGVAFQQDAQCPPFSSLTPSSSHPYLLFHDITSVYGYSHQNQYPWNIWLTGIKSNADAGLNKDYTKPWSSNGNGGPETYTSQAGYYAMSMSMYYQITKNTAYANKAKEELINLDIGYINPWPGGMTPNAWKAMGTMYYCYAYDMLQPYLTTSEDSTIRDKLAIRLNSTYYDTNYNGTQLANTEPWDGNIPEYCTLGVGAVVLADWNNPHSLNLKTGPDDWYRVATQDLFVKDTRHTWTDMPYNTSMIGLATDPTGRDL